MLLRDFVNKKIASADKEASAEGVPLTLENCKKYKKMRDLKVYGNCFQDGTPTPENPIEVQCVGEKSRNLFDFENASILGISSVKYNKTSDSYILSLLGTGTGNLKIYFGKADDFIGKTLTMSVECANNIGSTYTQLIMITPDGVILDDNAIGGGSVYEGNRRISTINVSEEHAGNDIAIRLYVYNPNNASGLNIEYKNIQVEIGSTATDFIPYGKYRVPIIFRGKNYFSMAIVKLPQQTINGITFTPLDDERIHITGKMLEAKYTTYVVEYGRGTIPLKAGQYRGKGFSNWDFNYGVYNSGGFLTNIQPKGGNVSKDGYLLNIYIGIPASVTQELDEIIELQVEKGTSVTPYEPYVEPITTNIYLDEPLRKVNTYADYIDGKNKKLHRLNHEYCIDGSQYIEPYSETECLVYGDVRCKNEYAKSASSHFPNFWFVGNTAPSWCMVNAFGNRINMRNFSMIDGVTDTETLKQWFAENPTTFIQPLETPIVEDLNIELPKLNAKTTIIEVDTSLAPSNISGKYIIR